MNHEYNPATASTGKPGSETPEMAGWEEVGYYASCLIYASGDMRRLIDRHTGTVITQYRFSQNGEGGKQMTDCRLILTCPYFNGEFGGAPELTGELKEKYCRDEYAWCGRYMAFKARERSQRITLLNLIHNDPMKQ